MVVPRSWASFCSPAATFGSTVRGTVSPREPASADRGRSSGRFSGCGTPASSPRQYSICAAAELSGSAASPSTSRCHSAYSLYCTGSGSHAGSRPARRAV
jgi:hypothetical protein